MAAPVIYNGIKFPFQKSGTSFPASSSDDELVRESLIQLVLTMNGERIMRPDFGSNAMTFLFENNSQVLGNLLRAEIRGIVSKYEPRIQVTDVRSSRRGSEVIITIVYLVLATRRAGTASFPIPVP